MNDFSNDTVPSSFGEGMRGGVGMLGLEGLCFFGGEDVWGVVGLVASDDDGATEPFGHGEFFFKGIMIDNEMVNEFHDMVVELFSVDVYA